MYSEQSRSRKAPSSTNPTQYSPTLTCCDRQSGALISVCQQRVEEGVLCVDLFQLKDSGGKGRRYLWGQGSLPWLGCSSVAALPAALQRLWQTTPPHLHTANAMFDVIYKLCFDKHYVQNEVCVWGVHGGQCR